MPKLIHAADFHLDSPFATLTPELARQRRRECRALPERLAALAREEGAELVLLSGDLFDGAQVYRETIEQLIDALSAIPARVFIAPGNHDFFSARSPYATLSWPENVHIFRSDTVERVVLDELETVVYGAAFTAPAQERSLLDGFSADARDGAYARVMVLHGDLSGTQPRYDPLDRAQIAASGLDYLALGHTHAFSGVQREGGTFFAYPGCPEGRGFDETGDKGVLCGTVTRGDAALRFVPLAKRRCRILSADVTDTSPEAALDAALSPDTADDLCRVLLTGETDERGIDLAALRERFAARCFYLELRDETSLRRDVWARAEEDSLRGLFLRDLREQLAQTDDEAQKARITQAARFGLAALDGRDW